MVAFVSKGNLHFLSLSLMMMIRLGPSDDGDDDKHIEGHVWPLYGSHGKR